MTQLQGAFYERAEEIIAVGRTLYQRGWLPATSGNLSARLDADRFAITASGVDKGALNENDIMAVNGRGHALESGHQPSAETLLHLDVYRRDPRVGAVLHVHSPNATVLSLQVREDAVVLDGYELLKALPGIRSHEAAVDIPVFDNDQDIARLAGEVDERLSGTAETSAYLIRGHGMYAWGATVRHAFHRLEALEFMFDCHIRLGRAPQ